MRLSSRRLLLCAAIAALTLVSACSPVAASQSCGISLTVQSPQVNLPTNSIPAAGGTTFSETFYINYSSSYANRTLTLQYQNNSRWTDLQSFVGNGAGFTELGYGLSQAWTRSGTNSVRVVSGTCASNASVFGVAFDPNAVWTDMGVCLSAPR